MPVQGAACPGTRQRTHQAMSGLGLAAPAVVADRVVGEELVSEEVPARRRPDALLRLTQPLAEGAF